MSRRQLASDVLDMSPQQVDLQGVNPEAFKARERPNPPSRPSDYTWTQYELRVGLQDGTGDGTVPASSGRAPVDCELVKQVFRLTGILHESAYRHITAQQVTVYSLIKIAADALWPEPSIGRTE